MVDYMEFAALGPFFEVIEGAIRDIVDGERYFDMLDENIHMEFRFAPLGTPKELRGRSAIIDSFRGYGNILFLERMTTTNVFKTDKPGVVIIEYAGEGYGVQTKKPYIQHYVSILTIRDRKVVHWVDYWDPIVSLEAIGGTEKLLEGMYG